MQRSRLRRAHEGSGSDRVIRTCKVDVKVMRKTLLTPWVGPIPSTMENDHARAICVFALTDTAAFSFRPADGFASNHRAFTTANQRQDCR
jgi:hypothetical protein